MSHRDDQNWPAGLSTEELRRCTAGYQGGICEECGAELLSRGEIDVPVIDRLTGKPLPMSEEVEGVVEEPAEAPPPVVVPYAPSAGMVLDLSDRPRVAATIRELDEWQELVLKPLISQLKAALIEEADTQASYTLRYGKFTVKVDGPDVSKYEWRDDLRPMLAELVIAGMPESRAREIAKEQTTWKPNHAEVNKARKVDKYREIIDRYRTPVPRTRSVSVKGG